jgi:hypothetical protein
MTAKKEKDCCPYCGSNIEQPVQAIQVGPSDLVKGICANDDCSGKCTNPDCAKELTWKKETKEWE